MAVLSSQKVRLIVHSSLEQDVLNFLQKEEVFHPTDLQNRQEISREGSHKWGEVEAALRFLRPFVDQKSSFSHLLVGEKVLSSYAQVEELMKEFPLERVLGEIQELEQSQQRVEASLQKITEKELFLREWRNVNFSIPQASKNIIFTFVRFPSSEEQAVKDQMAQLEELIHVEIVGETETSLLCLVVCEEGVRSAMKNFLTARKGEEVSFDAYQNSPREAYAQICKEKKEWEEGLQKIEESIVRIAKNSEKLKLAADYYLWQRQKEEVALSAQEMGTVSVFEGWVLKADLGSLKKRLEQSFQEVHLEELDVAGNQAGPVQLKNKSFFRPFEIVTRIFGLPASTELDPTPFLAPFFVFFFAFCLTDAGYGILLSISTFAALRFLVLDAGTKQMLILLFMGGVMTIILGALFGGWFGIPLDMLPPIFQKIQIFDPIQDLQTKIAPLAFSLGIFQLWFGVVLSGVTKVKNRMLSEALQTSFPLAIALVCAVLWGVSGKSVFEYIFLGLLVFLVWGFGYGTKNVILRPLMGILALVNEAVGWLSNVPSYSRLFALGLATGIVAQVFNSLAFTIGGLIPVPGLNILFIVGIILFGHLLNIALNLLGAFIHSGRLQFIEFFGKFIDGGGSEFSPLKRDSKYLFIRA